MKRIINIILAGVIFYVGNMFFSEYISYDKIQTLVIAILVFAAADYIYGIACTLLMGVSCFGGLGGVLMAIIPIILTAIIWTPLKLVLMDRFVPGFSINGILTYVLLTVALSIFSVEIKTEKK